TPATTTTTATSAKVHDGRSAPIDCQDPAAPATSQIQTRTSAVAGWVRFPWGPSGRGSRYGCRGAGGSESGAMCLSELGQPVAQAVRLVGRDAGDGRGSLRARGVQRDRGDGEVAFERARADVDELHPSVR